ncbi:MAG: hypothetical protein J6N72_05960 [Psychrobacter sp.]|nr:hypothetical protein [Psychrobacter sp.]
MAKQSLEQRVALHIKNYIEGAEGYTSDTKYIEGSTVITKKSNGLITAHIDDQCFFTMETNVRQPYESFLLFNAKAVKHINALKDLMGWKFTLHWNKNNPYGVDGWNKNVPLAKDFYYSLDNLEAIKY